VAFSVGGNAATQAKKDDVVTVSVTPNEGYSAKDVTVRAYTSWEAANARRRSAPRLVSDITVTKNETDGTWSFTMPEANVWVVVTYTKNLQDAWIQAITDHTYTGSAIEPTIEVKDGETTLTLNTDYTVAYSNNVETGTATVTVTGTGNYSGTATATFAILADKEQLNIEISGAEGRLSYFENYPDIVATFQDAIDAAKQVRDNPLATQDEADQAIEALGNAWEKAMQQWQISENIAIADDIYNSAKDVSPEAAATFLGVINATREVRNNPDATMEQLSEANQNISNAYATLLTAVKDDLGYEITEAEAYYNSIKDNNPAAAGALQTAIDAAKGVKDNADATAVDICNAIAALSEAVSTARVEVSRITLTIPAKSYMARIDADKRQIETAVAGVKLFSVKSVTNTEVVLTDELSVIAAEMPYFIYNDNDTEVEVSIIVSSEDADNVDYDSDHFKGTLVDKTFTDEDMEEADHYVLNGGSSFVWVKDAGTLAAGKCWIQLEKSPANARALSIVFEGETTGISTVKTAADKMDGEWYDLSGRRVAQPAKGIYVKNGKKVIVRSATK